MLAARLRSLRLALRLALLFLLLFIFAFFFIFRRRIFFFAGIFEAPGEVPIVRRVVKTRRLLIRISYRFPTNGDFFLLQLPRHGIEPVVRDRLYLAGRLFYVAPARHALRTVIGIRNLATGFQPLESRCCFVRALR